MKQLSTLPAKVAELKEFVMITTMMPTSFRDDLKKAAEQYQHLAGITATQTLTKGKRPLSKNGSKKITPASVEDV